MKKKITKATLKSFIKKNHGNLYINYHSDFNGMIDGVDFFPGSTFSKAKHTETDSQVGYNLGIVGLHLVGGSRNWFDSYVGENFTGITYSNCCGSATIAIRNA